MTKKPDESQEKQDTKPPPVDLESVLGQNPDTVQKTSKQELEDVQRTLEEQSTELEMNEGFVPNYDPASDSDLIILSAYTRVRTGTPEEVAMRMQGRILELEKACLKAQLTGSIDPVIAALGSPYSNPSIHSDESKKSDD